jgi:hypothetical protein
MEKLPLASVIAPCVVPWIWMLTPGRGPSAADVTLPVTVFPCPKVKPIAKQKMRRERRPLLHRNTEFRIVPIIVFF